MSLLKALMKITPEDLDNEDQMRKHFKGNPSYD